MHALIAAAQDGPSPIAPHPWEFVIGLIAFSLLVAVLWRAVVPRFEATFAQRTEEIEGGILRAERAQAEAQEALERYRAQLADARGEANRIRQDAQEQGSAILAEMRERAQQESARLLEQAHIQIDAERSQAVRSLRTEVGGLATTLASRIVGESLADEARQSRVVERFLADLEASEGADGQVAASASTPSTPATATSTAPPPGATTPEAEPTGGATRLDVGDGQGD